MPSAQCSLAAAKHATKKTVHIGHVGTFFRTEMPDMYDLPRAIGTEGGDAGDGAAGGLRLTPGPAP